VTADTGRHVFVLQGKSDRHTVLMHLAALSCKYCFSEETVGASAKHWLGGSKVVCLHVISSVLPGPVRHGKVELAPDIPLHVQDTVQENLAQPPKK
jgi:hypothetical protein